MERVQRSFLLILFLSKNPQEQFQSSLLSAPVISLVFPAVFLLSWFPSVAGTRVTQFLSLPNRLSKIVQRAPLLQVGVAGWVPTAGLLLT